MDDPSTTPEDSARILGPGGATRMHAIEYAWLDSMRAVGLFAYRLPADAFTPYGSPEPHAHVSASVVCPLGPPERVGDLFRLHEEAGIELRALTNLWPLWDETTASSLGFSGIRLRNATPRM